ncbi:MAG TPA: tRNA preQ1(34) S-adenosylmethionine ribosyltransferase-isomerase QueA, partial [bacterium]|nr:tRNA preQ1(34) S-adenosylmethionine ribosyltransferase-isomerase QueA [bacterium]
MNLNDYDYNLPVEKIAQKPTEHRDKSRLMVIDIGRDSISHRTFSDLPELLHKGDLLVINDTKVFAARLTGKKETTGGAIELFLLRRYEDGTWDALSRPAKRLRKGLAIIFGNGLLRAEVVKKGLNGHVRVRLESEDDIDATIDRLGKTPLPPYIKREADDTDRERYQTVYAQKRGAVAAPTAGLHFTESVLNKLTSRGIKITSVTLHVGIGTFRPLSEEEAENNRLHSEYCHVPQFTVRMVKECRDRGCRVIAVGTTTARALESASAGGEIGSFEGWTDIFIKPSYTFKSVDSLITNFHL